MDNSQKVKVSTDGLTYADITPFYKGMEIEIDPEMAAYLLRSYSDMIRAMDELRIGFAFGLGDAISALADSFRNFERANWYPGMKGRGIKARQR
jgi:hypothetical protein